MVHAPFDPNALLHPAAYPWQPTEVTLIETHISWVFLAGENVVKVKRPVTLDFVDHSTVERRKHSCVEEVRLNRRLTNDVYLGVVPITATAHGLVVDGDGVIVEWATLMRRMSAADMLDERLARNDVPEDLVDRLADRLMPFHAGIPALGVDDVAAVTDMLMRVVTDNLAELAAYALVPVHLDLVARSMHAFISSQQSRLRQRTAGGWVRDGHGDLRADHVCVEMDGATQVFDCIEFNPDVRCVDVASDLAFLLMDLDRLGATDTAKVLLDRYLAAGFDLPDDVMRFYWSHRALVRAKVLCVSDAQAGGTEHAVEARSYLSRASRQVLTVKPSLICMSGLSGTGKSSIGQDLAQALGIPLVATDVVRKHLAGVLGSAAADPGAGIYGPGWTERTYDHLLARGNELLTLGTSVMLDGTFLDGEQRVRAADLARQHGVPFVLVETVCDEDEVIRRLQSRAATGTSVSDAGVEVFRYQQAMERANPAPVPDGTLHLNVDTTTTNVALLDPVLDALVRAGIVVPEMHPEQPLRFAPAWDQM